MIIDATGIELIPGNQGKDCPGNGTYKNEQGCLIECCCEECNYYLCCIAPTSKQCAYCIDPLCPRAVR